MDRQVGAASPVPLMTPHPAFYALTAPPAPALPPSPQTDGVIMFSDILTPLPALGIEFDVIKGKGPRIDNPIDRCSQCWIECLCTRGVLCCACRAAAC